METGASILDSLEARLARGLRQDARTVGRAESTARVLLALDPASGTAMGQLAARIDRDASTVTRFVYRATSEGLVERRSAVSDRRTRLLFLTPAGRAARADLVRLRAGRAGEIREAIRSATSLGEEEVEWFLEALDRALGPAYPVNGGP